MLQQHLAVAIVNITGSCGYGPQHRLHVAAASCYYCCCQAGCCLLVRRRLLSLQANVLAIG
jgi:hypothetical protein